MKWISTSFQRFNELYEKAEADPDSVINHIKF